MKEGRHRLGSHYPMCLSVLDGAASLVMLLLGFHLYQELESPPIPFPTNTGLLLGLEYDKERNKKIRFLVKVTDIPESNMTVDAAPTRIDSNTGQ